MAKMVDQPPVEQAPAAEPKPKKKVVKKTTGPVKFVNTELALFDEMVSQAKQAVEAELKARAAANDNAPETILHYTNRVLKTIVGASRWA